MAIMGYRRGGWTVGLRGTVGFARDAAADVLCDNPSQHLSRLGNKPQDCSQNNAFGQKRSKEVVI